MSTPEQETALNALTDEQRAIFDHTCLRAQRDDALKDAYKAELLARIEARRPTFFPRIRNYAREAATGVSIFVFVAFICVGGTSIAGACVGVFVYLIRLAWNLGACT